MRTRTLLLLAIALTATTLAIGGVAAGGAAPLDSAPAIASVITPRVEPAPTGVLRASSVLRAWDHRRAAAWAHGDAGALADLYAARSRTGARDVRDLRRWRERGLRVVDLQQQVAQLVVHVEAKRRLVLRVTDRTVDGVAVGRHGRTAIPRSAWTRHRIVLRHAHGRWRVDEVVQPAR
jgi:hypothetical protein